MVSCLNMQRSNSFANLELQLQMVRKQSSKDLVPLHESLQICALQG